MSVGAVNKQTGDRIPTAGMPAIDDALDLTSVNPVQNDIITAALALKQDKTDNSLQTTDKTVPGAINELKSGLTNVDVALSVPYGTGKNLIPMTVASIKEWNTEGVWADNVYTINDVAYTINTDSNGNVISVIANGTASASNTRLKVCPRSNYDNMAGCILSGCPSNDGDYRIRVSKVASPYTSYTDNTGGDTVISNSIVGNYSEIYIQVNNGKTAENVTFYPMIRPAAITDSTYAPYIPSVDARLDAVESDKIDIVNGLRVYPFTGTPNTSGRYYTLNISDWSYGSVRYPFIILYANQGVTTKGIIIGNVTSSGTVNIEASEVITYDAGTKTFTANLGANGYCAPLLIAYGASLHP